jgi:hypothetical protein
MEYFKSQSSFGDLRVLSGQDKLPTILRGTMDCLCSPRAEEGFERANELYAAFLEHVSSGRMIHLSMPRLRAELDERTMMQVFKTIRQGVWSLVTTGFK